MKDYNLEKRKNNSEIYHNYSTVERVERVETTNFIYPHHYKEWQESAIAPEIIEANLRTVAPCGDPWDMGEAPEIYYFLFPDDLDRRNDGRLTTPALRKYETRLKQIEGNSYLRDGGWWSQGFDLLTGM
jgi:hypothetical protein